MSIVTCNQISVYCPCDQTQENHTFVATGVLREQLLIAHRNEKHLSGFDLCELPGDGGNEKWMLSVNKIPFIQPT